jgi:hypothetical protein
MFAAGDSTQSTGSRFAGMIFLLCVCVCVCVVLCVLCVLCLSFCTYCPHVLLSICPSVCLLARTDPRVLCCAWPQKVSVYLLTHTDPMFICPSVCLLARTDPRCAVLCVPAERGQVVAGRQQGRQSPHGGAEEGLGQSRARGFRQGILNFSTKKQTKILFPKKKQKYWTRPFRSRT